MWSESPHHPKLAAAQRGDPEARAELLHDLQDVVFRFCAVQLADVEAARDATQETALRILRGLASFRRESRLKTWVLGIALNVCRESRRADRRHAPCFHSTTPPDLLPSSLLRPDDIAVEREQEAALDRRVRSLPERQREAIVLRYFEELSVEETASIMQVAVGTVKAASGQFRLKFFNNRIVVSRCFDRKQILNLHPP